MNSKWIRFLMILLSVLLILIGCTGDRKGVQKTVAPTPTPPSELLGLPEDAQIGCDDNPIYQTDVYLWELPGLEAVDPESSSGGNTGNRLGLVEACTTVQVTDYAWSEADQTFYVYVEMDSLKGWLLSDYVDFVK